MTPKRAMEVFLETPGEVFVHAFPALGVTGITEKFFGGPEGLPRMVTVKFSPAYGPRLTLDADGVRQVLSFEKVDSPVFIPWGAVFAMHRGGCGVTWVVEPPVELEKKPLARLQLVRSLTP